MGVNMLNLFVHACIFGTAVAVGVRVEEGPLLQLSSSLQQLLRLRTLIAVLGFGDSIGPGPWFLAQSGIWFILGLKNSTIMMAATHDGCLLVRFF